MKPQWLAAAALVIAFASAIGFYAMMPTTDVDPSVATDPMRDLSQLDDMSEAFASEPRIAATPNESKSNSAALTHVSMPDGFVGTASCAGCHAEHYASYLATHHSRSLSVVDARREMSGSFNHELSKTSFHATTSESGLVHQQSVLVPTSSATREEFPISELPVKYVMGSGAFAKAYLLEDREFLAQSPVTWYRKPNEYAMAPGYDIVAHLGTTRTISDECLFCHAGLVTRKNGNDEKLVIHELAINCERCHGAGAEHAELYSALKNDQADRVKDAKIVNPHKLDRAEAESICAQCHLQGDISVDSEGHAVWDFQPGGLLSDTRVTYKIDKPTTTSDGATKTFVDHFDQLWQSACYQQSETLTCITCHDPHHTESELPSSVVQSQHCMSCHADEACGLAHEVRVEREQNVCFRCHMPRVDSEVPHTATTNHRIAIPSAFEARVPSATDQAGQSSLRRLHSPLDPVQPDLRSRAIALARWQLDGIKNDARPKNLSETAIDELLKIVQSDPNDAVCHLAIARLYSAAADVESEDVSDDSKTKLWGLAQQHALKVLSLESLPTSIRKQALEIMLAKTFDDGEYETASRYGIELIQIGRNAKDIYNTGLALGRMQQFSDAEMAFREAIRIDGTYTAPYRSLFKLYSAANPALAAQIREIGMMLETREAEAFKAISSKP